MTIRAVAATSLRVLLCAIALLLCCTIPLRAQQPRGDRMVAFQIDQAENNNYDSAFSYAKKACMNSVHLAFAWNQMEATPHSIGGPLYNLLTVLNEYYPVYGTQVELQIPVINTVARGVPTDLADVSFDAPIMIHRFETLLDSVFQKIPNVTLAALNVGNESDVYLGTNATSYAQFKTFLDSVAAYAKSTYFTMHGTTLNVGTTFRWRGLTDAATKDLCKQVNQERDIISVTYYPLDLTFHVEDPSVVTTEFETLIAEYPNASQPIYFVECGYPSSASCGSSLAMQSEFIHNVFTAWDLYAANVKYVTFFKTTDWSQGAVDTMAVYYGLPHDTAFKEYMRTLGLRTLPGNGSNKPAYDTLLCQLAARAFCSTSCVETGVEDPTSNAIQITVSPNPFSETATFQVDGDAGQIIQLRFYDVLGRDVRSYAITNSRIEVVRGELPRGLYLYKVSENGRGTGFGKIVIQ